MQEGADRSRRRSREGGGSAAHPERSQGVEGRGPDRRRRRDRAVRCAGREDRRRWSRSTAKPTSLRATTNSGRSRPSSRRSSRATARPTSRHSRRSRSPSRRDGRGAPHGARAEDRREHDDPPLRARRPPGQLASYVHGARIGVLVDVDGRSDTLGKDLAMHVAASKPMAVSSDQVPRGRRREGARDRRGARGRVGKARQHRREDGRGRRREIPGRSHAARASLSSRATASRRSSSS